MTQGNPRGLVRYLKYLQAKHPNIESKIIAAKISTLQPRSLVSTAKSIWLKSAKETASNFTKDEATPPFTLTKHQLRALTHHPINTLAMFAKDSRRIELCRRKKHLNEDDIRFFMQIASINKQKIKAKNQNVALNCITRQKATSLLNVSKLLFSSLVKQQIISPAMRASRREDMFYKKDVEALIKMHISTYTLSDQLHTCPTTTNRLALHLSIAPSFEAPHTASKLFTIGSASLIEASFKSLHNHRRPIKTRPSLARASQQYIKENDLVDIRQVSELLKINQFRMRTLVASNLLTAVAKGSDNTLYYLRSEVLDFHQKFISATDAARLLNIPLAKTTQILAVKGVKSSCGPEVDGRLFRMYPRVQVEQLVESNTKLIEFETMSIREAGALLRLPYRVIQDLKDLGVFRPPTDQNLSTMVLSADAVREFDTNYVRIYRIYKFLSTSKSCAVQLLESYGVYPLLPTISTDNNMTIYKASELEKIGIGTNTWSVETTNLNSKTGYSPPGAIDHIELSNSIDLSITLFSRLFLHTNYIKPLIFKQKKWILPLDVAKIRNIINIYYILGQRHKKYSTAQIRSGIRTGRLRTIREPSPHFSSQTFLLKSDLDTVVLPSSAGRRHTQK
jgi:hypothetical protein